MKVLAGIYFTGCRDTTPVLREVGDQASSKTVNSPLTTVLRPDSLA